MTEEKTNLVLTIPNKHIVSCGVPPNLVASDHYTAYFENDYGEQLVFTYDRAEHKGTLWHGDWGWKQSLEVHAGLVPDMILSDEEKRWLSLVWEVATKCETEEVKLKSRLALARAEMVVYQNLATAPELKGYQKHVALCSRANKRWQKEEQAILKRLTELGAVAEAENIVKGDDIGKGNSS